MTDGWYRQAFGAHYRLLYAHRDEAEAGRCVATIGRLTVPFSTPVSGLPTLDLGCGDGRHLPLLAERGNGIVVGLDLSPQLLEHARKRRPEAPAFPLVRADMRRLPFQPGSMGRVLSLFTAFGYFGTLADNAPVIAGIRRTLAAGGLWVLDYFDCGRVRAELGDRKESVRRRTLGPVLAEETRRLADDGGRVVKRVVLRPADGREPEAAGWGIEAGGLSYVEEVAVFSLDELDETAAATGLRRVAAAGGYAGQELGAGDRWILVYRKNGDGETEAMRS